MACYPEQLKLDNQLCFLLYSASRSMTRLYRPLLDELGLTYPQYLVMLVLWEAEDKNGLSVGDIGEALKLDSGTLTPLLKRLEGTGFLIRERRQDDERKVIASLTEKGCALRERAELVPLKLMCKVESDSQDMAAQMQLMEQLKVLNKRLADVS